MTTQLVILIRASRLIIAAERVKNVAIWITSRLVRIVVLHLRFVVMYCVVLIVVGLAVSIIQELLGNAVSPEHFAAKALVAKRGKNVVAVFAVT